MCHVSYISQQCLTLSVTKCHMSDTFCHESCNTHDTLSQTMFNFCQCLWQRVVCLASPTSVMHLTYSTLSQTLLNPAFEIVCDNVSCVLHIMSVTMCHVSDISEQFDNVCDNVQSLLHILPSIVRGQGISICYPAICHHVYFLTPYTWQHITSCLYSDTLHILAWRMRWHGISICYPAICHHVYFLTPCTWHHITSCLYSDTLHILAWRIREQGTSKCYPTIK